MTEIQENKIFRFKFTNGFTSQLQEFSKIHKHDDTKTFKEFWHKWVDNNRNIVESEARTLENNGYVGNPYDKMYKSARYYYKNKSDKEVEAKKRKKYISLPREIIISIDEHIEKNIRTKNYTPANGFEQYYENIDNSVVEMINIIKDSNNINQKEMENKIKKTYKNRYYNMTH